MYIASGIRTNWVYPASITVQVQGENAEKWRLTVAVLFSLSRVRSRLWEWARSLQAWAPENSTAHVLYGPRAAFCNRKEADSWCGCKSIRIWETWNLKPERTGCGRTVCSSAEACLPPMIMRTNVYSVLEKKKKNTPKWCSSHRLAQREPSPSQPALRTPQAGFDYGAAGL